MNLTFKIADREAIPARAIPFVAGTDTRTLLPRIQPSLIWQSARLAANAWSPGIPALHLYLIQDGEPVRATLAFLDAVANETEFLPEFDYPIRDSARRLPAELFVFADELQRFVGWLFPAGADEGMCADAPQLDLSLQLPSGALGTGGVLDLLSPADHCAAVRLVPTTFRPRIAWQIALFDAWPAMRKMYGRDPISAEAIRYLKKHDTSNFILSKGGDMELWWQPLRGEPKEVQFKTVETCISGWRTRGLLPA